MILLKCNRLHRAFSDAEKRRKRGICRIFSSIHANDNIRHCPAAIQKSITYLTETDFDKLEDGVYEIDGKNMFAQVFHNTTKPVEETKPELHRQYLDVQFWISGEELFGIAPSNGAGRCMEEIDERNLYFYDGVANESFVHAAQGCYAVSFRTTHTVRVYAWMARRCAIARWSSRSAVICCDTMR